MSYLSLSFSISVLSSPHSCCKFIIHSNSYSYKHKPQSTCRTRNFPSKWFLFLFFSFFKIPLFAHQSSEIFLGTFSCWYWCLFFPKSICSPILLFQVEFKPEYGIFPVHTMKQVKISVMYILLLPRGRRRTYVSHSSTPAQKTWDFGDFFLVIFNYHSHSPGTDLQPVLKPEVSWPFLLTVCFFCFLFYSSFSFLRN